MRLRRLKASQLPQALQEMMALRVEPDVRDFTFGITSCSDQSLWREALAIFRSMASRDGIAFGAAIHCCARSALWCMALQLLEEMQGQRPRV